MRIVVYTDAHFSINSSIILGKVGSLEGRLSHLIDSFKWIGEVAKERNCDLIVNCGDLVDSTTLRSEEITALAKALRYHDGINCTHVMGNHEILTSDGSINSINFIENLSNHKLMTSPIVEESHGTRILYLPYGDYEVDNLPEADICFSHIDISNSDLNGFKLQARVDPSDLAKKYKLVINGHIHNHGWLVKDKVLNLGALSGQNFSSTSKSYIAIVDTDDFSCELIENPYSLRFIKKEYKQLSRVVKFIDSLDEGRKYGIHLVVPVDIAETTRDLLDKNPMILSSRVTAIRHIISPEGEVEPTYDTIEKISDNESGFKALRTYVSTNSIPFEVNDILKVIDELEVFKK